MQVFSSEWFAQHQRKILWLANTKIGRKILRIDGQKSSVGDEQIVKIIPNAIFWKGGQENFVEFRTHDKFAKRLYYAFKPFWYFIHFLDWIFLDRFAFANKWSFGFSSLTVYPNADVETTSVDGIVRYSSDPTWATVRDAATGTTASDTTGNTLCPRATLSGGTYDITRGFFLFDTSALTATAVVSAAVLSIASDGSAVNNGDTSSCQIVASTPASNTALTTADYDQVGTTVFGSIALSSWTATDSTYNDFTLDSNGIAAVSLTSISKYGARNSRDTSNSAPTGTNTIGMYFADHTGSSVDPKLVITYSNAYAATLSEVVTVTDTVSSTKGYNRSLDEIVTITDGVSVVKAIVLTLSNEAVTLVETFTKTTSRSFLEAITITDNVLRTIDRLFLETVVIAEDFLIHVAVIFSQSFTETVSIVEDFIKSRTKILNESITITDIRSFFVRLKGRILGRNNDTNLGVGRKKEPISGRNNDTNIIIGKQSN